MSTILGFILFFAILVPLLIFALVAYIVRSVTGNSLTGFIIGFVVWKFFYERKGASQHQVSRRGCYWRSAACASRTPRQRDQVR